MNFAIDRDLLATDPARAVTETLNANRGYLRQQILPYFSGRSVADIDRREVHDWFASLRATPVAADRSVPVLSVIMREAEAMGLRLEGSKPAAASVDTGGRFRRTSVAPHTCLPRHATGGTAPRGRAWP